MRILQSAVDPAGDALGKGYRLPVGVDQASLDLRRFTAIDRDGSLELRLGMNRLVRQETPNGFRIPVFEIFIGGKQKGLNSLLDPTGFHTPVGLGWQYHLHLTGFEAKLTGQNGPVKVSIEGTEVVIKTPIKADDYAYWAFVGLYDPLSTDGLKRVGGDLPSSLQGNFNAPPVLDILFSGDQKEIFKSLEVPAIMKSETKPDVLLITAFIGLGVALLATIISIFRR